jgi:hypothetical protein
VALVSLELPGLGEEALQQGYQLVPGNTADPPRLCVRSVGTWKEQKHRPPATGFDIVSELNKSAIACDWNEEQSQATYFEKIAQDMLRGMTRPEVHDS